MPAASRIVSSQAGPTGPQLSKREFEEIRQLAYSAFGLDLKPGKEEMVSARLGRLVSAGGFRSFHEYTRYVATDSSGKALAALIDALATNHTSFLREREHFDFFRKFVAPALARRGSPEIWCAACSTGEEVWTLACIWNDAFPEQNLRIQASDISNKALRYALAGEYPKEACAPLPAGWLKRYFEPSMRADNRYRVRAHLRAQAAFRRINLMEPLPWQRRFPAIFCRNVMIYFDRQTRQDVVRRLTDSLEPGGYFFTGHAESLAGSSHTLEYVQPALYRKPEARRAT
jgi:chemotaxis protein methyltransferase CheR